MGKKARRHGGTKARSGSGGVGAAVEKWFAGAARAMPWRVTPRDPYLSLVSEFMLQQTQVVRVLEKFAPFVARFPTVTALAAADEQDVLGLWSGLGYYRRARLLHAAAKSIVAKHDGNVPSDPAALRGLAGVGRYTAGAIASIVFGKAEPIVDGNVSRVLMRVHGREGASDDPAVVSWAWEKSAELAAGARSPGALNEGLMELGAVVCTPRAPKCESCPLARLCAARSRGEQEQIPRPKAAGARRAMAMECVLISDRRGRVLMQKRPGSGMWASMWQVPTLENPGRPASAKSTQEALGRWIAPGPFRRVDAFVHSTSHRDVRVRVWRAQLDGTPRAPAGTEWVARARASELALSNLQRRVLASLRGGA